MEGEERHGREWMTMCFGRIGRKGDIVLIAPLVPSVGLLEHESEMTQMEGKGEKKESKPPNDEGMHISRPSTKELGEGMAGRRTANRSIHEEM